MANTLPHRIEAAEGADRALDGEIDRMMNARPKDGDYDAHEGAFWRVGDHSGLLVHANGFARDAFSALDYTASIDAALTLVPEGLYPTICFVTKQVWLRDKNGHDLPGGVAYGFGKNVPNSICAAALRAKESSDGE